MLRKTLYALGCAAGMMGMGSSAQAATIVFSLMPPSGTFVSGPVKCDTGPANCAGTFTATGSFSMPAGYRLVSGSITTTAISNRTNIDFSSATLNGSAFTLSPTGVFEFGSLNPIPLQAINTLIVTGYTGGRASFAGDLAFAVPEPATWALLMFGFAGIGTMVRRRKHTQVRAHLQMA